MLTGPRPVFELPRFTTVNGGTKVIAIRVWHWPYWANYYGGGPQGRGYIGDPASINEIRRAEFPGNQWGWASTLFSALLCVLGGICAFGFAWQHRREREYFWFAVWLLFKAYIEGLPTFIRLTAVNIEFREISRNVAEAGGTLCFLAFYYYLLRFRPEDLLCS